MLNLDLPDGPVPSRVSVKRSVPANERVPFAEMEGPGCIRHIWVALKHPKAVSMGNRKILIRILFDDEPVPFVEAPVGDFFGLMHGLDWYDLNTPFLSAKAWNGMNCYFPMPFAGGARVEFEAGPEDQFVHMQLDWHRYPNARLAEPRRFCARWRRENPTERYGRDFLMLDADGPGQLLGFVYGVRLLDDVDRWSHGGSDNIYIDGQGDHPAYLRGIGGEDTFGAGYGGALHPPETHLYAAMPYYMHEDVGDARPAQRLAGYRFFVPDAIPFRESIHLRFGCMRNDICSTVYWYQQGAVRPFFRLPDFSRLLPGTELPGGTCDLPLPDTGSWWICGPFGNAGNGAMKAALPAESERDTGATCDAMHEEGSPWLTAGSKAAGLDAARRRRYDAIRGFVDFNHAFRPHVRGVAPTHPGVAIAKSVLHAPRDLTARLRIAWDDQLILSVNDGKPDDLGHHSAFVARTVEVPLRKGQNTVRVKLSNTAGSTHGGWAFAFRATTPDGSVLVPQCEKT